MRATVSAMTICSTGCHTAGGRTSVTSLSGTIQREGAELHTHPPRPLLLLTEDRASQDFLFVPHEPITLARSREDMTANYVFLPRESAVWNNRTTPCSSSLTKDELNKR